MCIGDRGGVILKKEEKKNTLNPGFLCILGGGVLKKIKKNPVYFFPPLLRGVVSTKYFEVLVKLSYRPFTKN